jgi:hypothetical protein
MNEVNFKEIFLSDQGILFEILVFDVSTHDWQTTLDLLRNSYVVIYSEDGKHCVLPEIMGIWKMQLKKSVMVEVVLPGFTINSHLHYRDRIDLNLRPEDVDSREKAESVFDLMLSIAKLLGKEVFMTPEFGSASVDRLREMAICVADPISSSIRTRPH